jgi:hypothetical protein
MLTDSLVNNPLAMRSSVSGFKAEKCAHPILTAGGGTNQGILGIVGNRLNGDLRGYLLGEHL